MAVSLAAHAQTNAVAKSSPADPNKPPAKWIGVMLGRVDDSIRVHLPRLFNGMPEGAGVLITGVMPESPALSSGLVKNDIILRADGEPVLKMQTLIEIVNRHNAATSVKLDIIREGQPKTVYTLVLERPAPVVDARQQMRDQQWGDFWNNTATTVTYTDADGKQQSMVIEQVGDLLRKLREDEKLFDILNKNGVEFHTIIPPQSVRPGTPQPRK